MFSEKEYKFFICQDLKYWNVRFFRNIEVMCQMSKRVKGIKDKL